MSFSILILTLNEQINLRECLASIAWCDDVVVLDSYSNDQTEEIARAHGTAFHQRPFDNFANQRNHALANVPFKHSWVFHLDADERFTPELRAECEKQIKDSRYNGFYVASKMMFMGRWLKHAASYPAYQLRLLRLGNLEFIQHGHGQRESDSSKLGFLKEPMLHYSFNKGLEDWNMRHDRYASDEARQNLGCTGESEPLKGLFSSKRIVRRRALKSLSARLPFRPILKFIYLYVIKRGFLDGRPGFVYCMLQSFYEFMIVLKTQELQNKHPNGQP